MESLRYNFGRNLALHNVQCQVYLWYNMSTTQWTVQGIFMVRNEHYTVNSARYIYGTKWELILQKFNYIYGTNLSVHNEQCKSYLCYEMSIKHWRALV